jgi:protein tyrosine phosphatase (PTP) superfamily phosphohydrolase (DUF442 family)
MNGGHRVTRIYCALIACFLAATSFGDDIDLAAVTSLKVDIEQVVEQGTVSAVDGVTSAGQPNEAALQVFADAGYVAVVDLRGVDEDRGVDEASIVGALGMHYANLPIQGRDAVNFENAKKLDELLAGFDGPVVVHCASGNRVGAMLALRAYSHGASEESALELGKDAGLTKLEDAVRERLAEGAE